jgi:hypothetical protein
MARLETVNHCKFCSPEMPYSLRIPIDNFEKTLLREYLATFGDAARESRASRANPQNGKFYEVEMEVTGIRSAAPGTVLGRAIPLSQWRPSKALGTVPELPAVGILFLQHSLFKGPWPAN